MHSLLICHKGIIRFATLTAFIIFCCCCEKDAEPLFENGMITGIVQIDYSSYAENALVTVHGPYGSKSARTNSSGEYKITRLGNGTYTMEVRKEGYGIIRTQSIQVFGNDTIEMNANLRVLADYKMPKLTTVLYYPAIANLDEHSIAIVTDIPNANTEQMFLRVFISDTKAVSFSNYVYTEIPSAYQGSTGTKLITINANPQDMNTNERMFESGQTIFLILYVCNFYDYPEFNEYYGRPIYTTIDEHQHSQVFKIPAP
jgi:hypothetical protein